MTCSELCRTLKNRKGPVFVKEGDKLVKVKKDHLRKQFMEAKKEHGGDFETAYKIKKNEWGVWIFSYEDGYGEGESLLTGENKA